MKDLSPLSAGARSVAEGLDELQANAHIHERVRARLLLAATEDEVPRPRFRRTLGVVPAVALSAAALLLLWLFWPKAPPVVAYLGTPSVPLTAGTWVYAKEKDPTLVTFSDRTEVALEPSSSAKILAVNDAGAALELRQGRARVEVVPRRGSDYRISAGPFEVHVRGTRFHVAWDPTRDRFLLELHEGSVTLSGCLFGTSFAVTAGQRVEASCRDRKLDVGPIQADPPARDEVTARGLPEAPPTNESSAPSDQARTAGAVRPPVTQPGSDTPDWTALARRGERSRAWAEAKSQGLDRALERASPQELMLLGDLARDMRDMAQASQIYQTVRRRAPGSASASFAAFALGRLEFDHLGAYGRAANWFDVYLKEQPRGDFAREARGRRMEALHRAHDDARARRVAQEYVRLHPKGPHAELAARLLLPKEPPE